MIWPDFATPSLVGASAPILVIHGASDSRRVLTDGLSAHGFSVDTADDAEQGIAAATTGDYRLILLEILLPDRSGLEVLTAIRAERPQLPVIILSALDGIDDRIRGLNAGAVDYVVKPFSLRELAARIWAHVRFLQGAQASLSAAGIEIDLLTRQVERFGVPIRLSTLEFRLLAYFMQHPRITVSRSELLANVWDCRHDPGTNLVDVYIGYLRRKLHGSDGDWPVPIQTIRGVGYRFDDAVPAVTAAAA